MYDHKAIEKSVDFLLNGLSYNITTKELSKSLDKFRDEDIDKAKMYLTILESHCGVHRNNMVSHISIMKISEKIKNLK